jgi:hypothetical protein
MKFHLLESMLALSQEYDADDNDMQQSDLVMKKGLEFALVNTCDMLISFLQVWALSYYFKAWRQLANGKAVDRYISITFTCIALSTLSRLGGTTIKCIINFMLLSNSDSVKNWYLQNDTYYNEMIKSFSICSAFVRNIGLAFNLFRWYHLLFLQNNPNI